MCFLKLLKFEYPNTALFIDLILLFNPYINPLVIFDLNIFSIYFKCFLKVFSAIIIFLEIFSLALKYFLTTLSNLLKLLIQDFFLIELTKLTYEVYIYIQIYFILFLASKENLKKYFYFYN